MGTRNITSVLMNGKQVVCQYGQWDGYPTYTGQLVLEFLRNADKAQLRNALKNTTIRVSGYGQALSYTGSTQNYSHMYEDISDAKRTLDEQNGRWPEFQELYDFLVKQGKYSQSDIENYFVWTRDTGCNILPLIYQRALDKPPLKLFAVKDEYDGQYGWDIQGVYVIDLDNNKLRISFNGFPLEYDLDHLPADIERAMLIYEYAVDALDEREADLNTVPAEDLVKDLVVSIQKSLQEDAPDSTPISAEDIQLIDTIVHNKADQRLRKLPVDHKIAAAEKRTIDATTKCAPEMEPDR